MTREDIKAQIREAFSRNEYPGDWCLKNSTEGEEPYLVEEEFEGKTDWTILDPEFLDQAPSGFASALNFFSDEAFRFYLPAYLIADLDDRLQSSDPTFHLTHGLDDATMHELINPLRYGGRTWFDEVRAKFAMFPREEIHAIVAYLEFKLATADLDMDRDTISQSLKNYWTDRRKEARPRDALYE